MKKLLAMILTGCMVLGVTACGGDTAAPAGETAPAAEETAPAAEETDAAQEVPADSEASGSSDKV